MRQLIWLVFLYAIYLLICSKYCEAHTDDPSLCDYWLHHLEKISVIEEQRVHDVPQWADELEPGVAEQWDANLAETIRTFMKRIENDCQRK